MRGREGLTGSALLTAVGAFLAFGAEPSLFVICETVRVSGAWTFW